MVFYLLQGAVVSYQFIENAQKKYFDDQANILNMLDINSEKDKDEEDIKTKLTKKTTEKRVSCI